MNVGLLSGAAAGLSDGVGKGFLRREGGGTPPLHVWPGVIRCRSLGRLLQRAALRSRGACNFAGSAVGNRLSIVYGAMLNIQYSMHNTQYSILNVQYLMFNT